MNDKDYWRECIQNSADECGLEITSEQLECLADGVIGGNECYDMAFYTPPASDRIAVINDEWKEKFKRLQQEFDDYRNNAEIAVKKALNQFSDANVSIGKNGEVTRHEGRSEVIQN